jgi:hypothetical protein
MKRNREFEEQARRVAEAAALSRLVAPIVREAMSDRKVRRAAGDAYEAGRRMYEEVRGSDPRHVVGRMARDEHLQNDVAALVRSATNAVDVGIARGRRRGRRSLVRFLMIATGAACFIGIALRRRHGDLPSDGDARDVRASEATTATAQTEWITG